MKFEENWPKGSEQKSFKGGWTNDEGQQVITIAHPEPKAQVR